MLCYLSFLCSVLSQISPSTLPGSTVRPESETSTPTGTSVRAEGSSQPAGDTKTETQTRPDIFPESRLFGILQPSAKVQSAGNQVFGLDSNPD